MTQTTSRGCSSPSWHPPFLFQKPPCWAHLWWDNKTLISGWQCASAQGSVSRQTLHGIFPKKMKGKPLCTQNMKETQWISGRLMNFRWTVMRGKTWLVCTILNQGSHREGLFICPDTVRATETILDWTLTHKVHLKYFYCFFARYLFSESPELHDSSAKPLQRSTCCIQTVPRQESSQPENTARNWRQRARVRAQL